MPNPPIVPAQFNTLMGDFADHLSEAFKYYDKARHDPPPTPLDPQFLASLSSRLIASQASYGKSQAEAHSASLALREAARSWPKARKSLAILEKVVQTWSRLLANSMSATQILLEAKDPERQMGKLESIWARNRLLAARTDILLQRGASLLATQTANAVNLAELLDQ